MCCVQHASRRSPENDVGSNSQLVRTLVSFRDQLFGVEITISWRHVGVALIYCALLRVVPVLTSDSHNIHELAEWVMLALLTMHSTALVLFAFAKLATQRSGSNGILIGTAMVIWPIGLLINVLALLLAS